jgi:molybdopterin synthase catalytic subunit
MGQPAQTAAGPGWFVEITEQPLDLLKLTQRVTQPAAGAISTFIGTTRNNFNNKAVLYLEYEAYVPMAVAKLKVRGAQHILMQWRCSQRTKPVGGC